MSIPVSVVVVTKNEERNIARCIGALWAFDEVVVVDSGSTDATVSKARERGARVFPFFWNGCYPKKRQWILDNLPLSHEWVFFVDADEVVTPSLSREIGRLMARGPRCAGYFVRGRYVLKGRPLRFGMMNNKLALLNRTLVEFPVVDDLDVPGMGEIEGHYQPVVKPDARGVITGQLREALLHHACDDIVAWRERHRRYAIWQAEVNRRGALPGESGLKRRLGKFVMRIPAFAPAVAFLHSYIFRFGLFDGRSGLVLAQLRALYYRDVLRLSRELRQRGGGETGSL